MAQVYLGVGSNLGNREENLRRAEEALGGVDGIREFRSSPVYETDPVGGPPQGKYLNAVWGFQTELVPEDLMRILSEIERRMGRSRGERDVPRTLDLDILFYGQATIREEELTIPHPRLHKRLFVLKPFSDLAPDWFHPEQKKTIQELLNTIDEKGSQS